jgi:hypothetical protein
MNAPTDRPDDPNLGARDEWLARVSEAASGLAASHTPEQPRGSSSGSTITVSYTSLPPSRDKSLDSTFLFAPPSQLRSRSKLAVCGGLMAIISSVAITAAIATGEFQPADIWHQLGLHPTTELASWLSRPAQLNPEQAIPRLIVQSSRVSSGEPMPLGVALRGRAAGAVVIIKGLVPGMELSVGNSIGTDAWQLPATDLGDAWIAPPESFVGSTNLVVELRLSDDKMADQQMIEFEWVPAIAPLAGTHGQSQEIAAGPLLLPPPTEKASAGSSIPPPQGERPLEEITAGPWISPSPTQFQPQAIAAEPPIFPPLTDRQLGEAVAGPPISPSPTQFQPQAIAAEPPIAPPPAQRKFDQEEIAVLLKRGKDLIANGDLAAARLVLQRAANANDAEAALALGATYDPLVLRALKVYGFKADPVMARVWYEKARELGSVTAPRRLEMLASGMR